MNNQQLWQAILGNLEVSISHGNFATWFKNTGIVERTDTSIIVGVPSIFIQKWITDKFHAEILKMLKQLAPEIKEVKYQIGHTKPTQNTHNPNINTAAIPTTSAKPEQYQPQQNNTTRPGFLNPKYIFNTFVIGKNNELAHAASIAVSRNPGGQYNPLYLYGGVGLGKTHLMHAVGNEHARQNPNSRVLYVTAEKFTNDFVDSLRNKKMDEFKQFYRRIDMLLVDDIQFIAGKESTQEEFFHTFNELRDRGKQVIITSDRLPKDIAGIEERLVSRFVQGMLADVQPPDLETRLAIMRNKMLNRGVPEIEEEVLNYIAENVTSNIRELEGALNRLVMVQQMEDKPLKKEHAEKILDDMIKAKKKGMSLKKIAISVAEFYNVTVDDLIKQSRRKEYVKPRQIAMYIVREELASSYPLIGDFFGGRDHTTVIHGVEKIDKMVKENGSLKQEVDLILDKLYVT